MPPLHVGYAPREFGNLVTFLHGANERVAVAISVPIIEEKVALALRRPALCTGIANANYAAECSSIIGTEIASATRSFAPCMNVTVPQQERDRQHNSQHERRQRRRIRSRTRRSVLPFIPNINYTARDFCYTLANGTANLTVCNLVARGSPGTSARSSPSSPRRTPLRLHAAPRRLRQAGSYSSSASSPW